jgi:hypothetical protein
MRSSTPGRAGGETNNFFGPPSYRVRDRPSIEMRHLRVQLARSAWIASSRSRLKELCCFKDVRLTNSGRKRWEEIALVRSSGSQRDPARPDISETPGGCSSLWFGAEMVVRQRPCDLLSPLVVISAMPRPAF